MLKSLLYLLGVIALVVICIAILYMIASTVVGVLSLVWKLGVIVILIGVVFLIKKKLDESKR